MVHLSVLFFVAEAIVDVIYCLLLRVMVKIGMMEHLLAVEIKRKIELKKSKTILIHTTFIS